MAPLKPDLEYHPIPGASGTIQPRLPWLDWLKVLGMQIILFGHSGGDDLIPRFFSPINPKQLGVAFFVFATGFTLANEKRSGSRIVFQRYFDVAYLGLFLCVGLSLIEWVQHGDLLESNYLPYLMGINVFWENAFPANPTTWFAGMYLHLLSLWALLLRWIPLNGLSFLTILTMEILIRAQWMSMGRDYNAYMCVTSWLTVFLLGRLAGKHYDKLESSERTSRGLASIRSLPWLAAIAGAAFLIGHLALVQAIPIGHDNPFGRIPYGDRWTSALLTSADISLQYLFYTLIVVCLLLPAPESRLVRFLASNTLWVFLFHMPLRNWILGIYYPMFPGWSKQIANFFFFFVGLAIVSHFLRQLLRTDLVKERISRFLWKH